MQRYKRPRHQLIAACLKNFNANYLSEHSILFGGGTRIVLELNEYRESVDIDFLCRDKDSFRAVREQVTNVSLGELVHEDFVYKREIFFDRYGVRTLLDVDGVIIKLEFISFENYNLKSGSYSSTSSVQFPVPYIDRNSCFCTKLLANADRYNDKPYKDIFDLVVMSHEWGGIPEESLQEAYSHYGRKTVFNGLVKALENLLNQQIKHQEVAADMGVTQECYTGIILPEANKLLGSLKV